MLIITKASNQPSVVHMLALPCTFDDRQGAAGVEGRYQARARQPKLEVAARRHFVIIPNAHDLVYVPAF